MPVATIPTAQPQQLPQMQQPTTTTPADTSQAEKNYAKPRLSVVNPGAISKTPIQDKLDTMKAPKAPKKEASAKNEHGDELIKLPEELEGLEKEEKKPKSFKNIFNYIEQAAIAGAVLFGGYKVAKLFLKSGIKEVANVTNLNKYKQTVDNIIKQKGVLKEKDFRKVILNMNDDTPKREAVENIQHLAGKFALVDNVRPKVKIYVTKEAQGAEDEIVEQFKSGKISDDVLDKIDLIELSKLTKTDAIEDNSILYKVKTQKPIDEDNIAETLGTRFKSFWTNLTSFK